VSALVSRLLNHYWTADDHPAVRQAQVEDWLEDLCDFDLQAIEDACARWRRSWSRRPTPADIVALVREAHAELSNAEPLQIENTSMAPLSVSELAEHRRSLSPFWDLVRRAQRGEDVELLIAERRALTERQFAENPKLRIYEERIEAARRRERQELAQRFHGN
jgi:hypothetical protein